MSTANATKTIKSSGHQSGGNSNGSGSAPKIFPLFDQVVIRRSVEEKTPGGIVLPEQSRGKSARGTVVAHGPGRRVPGGGSEKPAVCVGNSVIFRQYSGTEIEVDGEDFLIVRDEDILAIVG